MNDMNQDQVSAHAAIRVPRSVTDLGRLTSGRAEMSAVDHVDERVCH
jgi:hypothetical protein